jgi:2-amino-4-hydroxy-6-hydroxymethyldihydropteridine diphosphokinase
VIAAVALGSNLGDRRAHLDYAVRRLAEILSGLRVSSYLETDPVDMAVGAPSFLNGAAVGDTTLEPRALLERLLMIERERGRERPFPHAPRTLDLDLVLYDHSILVEPDLVVPHPAFRTRRFVLDPLAEIAPELVDPLTGLTVRELRERILYPSNVPPIEREN